MLTSAELYCNKSCSVKAFFSFLLTDTLKNSKVDCCCPVVNSLGKNSFILSLFQEIKTAESPKN